MRFFPTSPRPPNATIRQVPSIRPSLRRRIESAAAVQAPRGPPTLGVTVEVVEADTRCMRPSRAVLGTIVLGSAALLAALRHVRDARVTPLALFRGTPARAAAFRTSAHSLAALAGGIAFGVAGGHTGSLRLLEDLVPLVGLGVAFLTVRALLIDVLLEREAFEPRLAVSAGEVALGAAVALLSYQH